MRRVGGRVVRERRHRQRHVRGLRLGADRCGQGIGQPRRGSVTRSTHDPQMRRHRGRRHRQPEARRRERLMLRGQLDGVVGRCGGWRGVISTEHLVDRRAREIRGAFVQLLEVEVDLGHLARAFTRLRCAARLLLEPRRQIEHRTIDRRVLAETLRGQLREVRDLAALEGLEQALCLFGVGFGCMGRRRGLESDAPPPSLTREFAGAPQLRTRRRWRWLDR